MRSELVFLAVKQVPNRYQLTRTAAAAARKLHRPHSRIEETVNEALAHLAKASSFAIAPKACVLELEDAA